MKPTILKVRLFGDPILRTLCKSVKEIGPQEQYLIECMLETMYEQQGIGLAAPQIGVNKQIFVLDVGKGQGPYAIINPKIIKKSKKLDEMEEGCLSIPKVHINIKRPKSVTVEFTDHMGEKVTRDLDGLLAKAFQHEYDHLQGKLITDYASEEELDKYKPQLQLLEQQSKE